MKFVILTNGYPSENDLYRNGFIHRRLIEYIKKQDHQFEVFVLNTSVTEKITYMYDGINVVSGNKELLEEYLVLNQPDRLLLHFINEHMIEIIEKINYKNKIFIWIHGVEGLAWYRRLFNFKNKDFYKYIINNTIHRNKFKQFIKRHNSKLHFIFVSKWMERIFKKDIYSKEIRSSIIPNIIDGNLFEYKPKAVELRKNILLIRPFSSKKYANDIAIDAINILSKESFFNELNFTIIGKGIYFDSLTDSLKQYNNVQLINNFLSQSDIALKHQQNGIFLCPTRQDAQGVSMCEAMSSGLVPITSNSTAIPEFVNDGVSGYLTNNADEIAEKIKQLFKDPKVFSEMSKNASHEINMKCGLDETILKELELIITND